VVVTSRLWQTTATAIRAHGDGGATEAVLIDSPYFPDELELLPTMLGQAGFEVDGLLATHADFDHLLGRMAFPEHTLGLAESSMVRLRSEPGAAQRELRDADDEHYVSRARPLALGGVQALPAPGYVELGEERLQLHPAEGHTADGVALVAPFAGVLVCGDYLSDVEIPIIAGGGSLEAYRATLARMAPLVEAAETVVPGHGSPHDRERTMRILDEDLGYLDALERGDDRPPLPAGRDSRRQRAIHSENLAAVG
jgi:glyoxylase-like metal-dependent hydrolase (beta-lactamase superfamily II)